MDNTNYNGIVANEFGTKGRELLAKGVPIGQTTSSPITSASLNPGGTPYTLPNNTPQSSATGLEAGIASANASVKTASDRDREARVESQKSDKSDLKNIMKEIMNSNNDIANVENTVDRSAQDRAKMEADKYTSLIEAEQLANRRQLENLQKNNPEGLFGGALQDRINNLNRDSVSKQADYAILQNSALRNFDTAKSIADRQVQMKLEPLKAKLDNLKFFYTANKADFDKEEDRLYSEKIKEGDRAYAKKEEIEKSISTMKLNAAQYAGSAASGIIEALGRINTSDPDALTKAAKIAGKYMSDPLDRAIKSAQLSKLNKEISLLGEPTAKEKKEEADKLKSKTGQNEVLKDKIDLVDSLINHSGLANRVGPNIQSRKGVGFWGHVGKIATVVGIPSEIVGDIKEATGSGQDFSGGVHKLASKEFVDTLINAKSQGATFGALTDREGDALRASATAINDWEIKDKNGQGTGVWNIDEASFKRELRNIQNLSKRAIYANNGTVFDSSEDATLDEVWNPNNMALDPANYYK